jgi:Tfp pilus assembly protein PilE
MSKFSAWFVAFFTEFFTDLWHIIKGFFAGIYRLIIGNPMKYINNLMVYSKEYTAVDWLLSLIFLVIFALLIVLVCLVIYQQLKRYIRFTKIEQDKMVLLNQMNLLERRIREGNVPSVQTPKVGSTPIVKKDTQRVKGNRFTKLNLIDEKYKYTVLPTLMTEKDRLSLSEIVSHFRNYAAFHHKLYYNEKVAAIFIAGLATSKILILEGISGTGKTSLPYVFGKFINNDANIISVQPSWRDRYEMMGYFNEFTKKFNETEFLSSVYEATYRTDVNLVVLDEMNLARVEYYFADFLSLLELPNSDEWQLEIVAEQQIGDPVHLKEGKIRIPENMWFIGTANNDDSTFAITDKVYDRASSISMNEKAVPFSGIDLPKITISYQYLKDLFDQALSTYQISKVHMDAIYKLDNHISKVFQITFGNRIMKQLETFVPVYVACGREEIEAIDYIIARKIIRKFETLNLPFMKKELEELVSLFDSLFGKNKLIESKTMILKFITQV